MTPKEKAEDLVLKYLRLQEPNYNWFHKGLAKQCALIAVDQIIESRKDDGAFDDTKLGNSSEYYTPHPMYLSYWNLVKTEINKL